MYYNRFYHFIENSAVYYACAKVTFQHLADEYWTIHDNDARLGFHTVDLASVHEVPTKMVHVRGLDANGKAIPSSAFPLCEISWDVPAKCCVALGEDQAQMWAEQNEWKCEVGSPDSVKEDF